MPIQVGQLPNGPTPWVTADPFLFCVHHVDAYPKGDEHLGVERSLLGGRELGSDFSGKDGFSMYHGTTVPGFPSHPHRGFETITIVRKGLIDHSDSLGATARIGPGDVQWMTAGRGIVHCEMFPLVSEQTNPTELFQIWLNLPRAKKMVEPYFTMHWAASIPVVKLGNEPSSSTVTVYAGEFAGCKALAPPPDSFAAGADAQVTIFLLELGDEAIELPAFATPSNRIAYFVDGDPVSLASADGDHATLQKRQFAQLPNVACKFTRTGNNKTRLLVLGGRAIGEPVVAYGPFVMNTKAEIQQAMMDYQRTQFGGWPWRGPAPVHARTDGRFALHPDGRREEPPVGR